ncbi:MAG: ABC transporter ATP-binding protein [Hyphomicrobiales bacterium]|nr:ABC transporter ATP-binding protein [Hyphomicrobiales bacterium]
MSEAVLQADGVSKAFGKLKAIDDVSLHVTAGERRLILGPNGAGKTTLFNLLTGDLPLDSGSIRLFGRDVTGSSTSRRARRGMARTYQIVTLFSSDTLLHNVVLALLGRRRLRWDPFLSLDRRADLKDLAHAVLQQVGLEALAAKPLSETSYGEKRRLEIGLALAQQPRLLLLDEPLAGLSAQERRQVQSLLEQIPRSIAIVMIEHDVDMALSFAERITLLHLGQLIVEGARDEVAAHPRTREVYLGH